MCLYAHAPVQTTSCSSPSTQFISKHNELTSKLFKSSDQILHTVSHESHNFVFVLYMSIISLRQADSMVCDGKDLAPSRAEVTAPPTPQPGMARPSQAPTTVSVSRPGDGAAAVAPWLAMGIGEMFCFDWAGNVLKDKREANRASGRRARA